MASDMDGGSEGSKLIRRFDLVEEMKFLFVRLVRVRFLPNIQNLYVEVKVGNLKATTFFDNNCEGNQVFAFEHEKIHAFEVEVMVKDKTEHVLIGRVNYIFDDIPKRVPPESALAPKWYRLQDQTGTFIETGEIMLSLWIGTQADEYFSHAWCSESDATKISGDAVVYTRAKVYMAPTLWYLRVNVIQAQDLLLRFHSESPDIFVQVDLGSLRLRTSLSKSDKPFWNEDLMFVAQEPFNDTLVLSVEQGTLAEHVNLGKHVINLKDVVKRLDNAGVDSLWYDLDSHGMIENIEEVKFASKLNARISLDGNYHVMEECSEYCSDFRPSSKDLWKPSIGVLELGILKATDLMPMRMGVRTDAYCVAKYGPKWVRTRTIVDSLTPNWNEQYLWDVYEPFTVITIAVFDNNHLDTEMREGGGGAVLDVLIAKIRIRLSSLERDKVYAHSYPLIGLHPSGVKKMGEIHLAVRFSWPIASSLNMCQFYTLPLFPKHHYRFPLSPTQFDNLRNQAVNIIARSLSRAEPPLGGEVVYSMLDMRSYLWSMRKGMANFNRIMSLIGDFVALWNWLEDVKYWKNPITSFLFHFLCILVFLNPRPILPMVSFYFFWIGLKHYSNRRRVPCHIDATLSGADIATVEDLEEELDVFPSEVGGGSLRWRYDRLRGIGKIAQTRANQLAIIGEKLQALSSWRDPRATALFLVFCVFGLVVTYSIPPKLIMLLSIMFYLRHPKFRGTLPLVFENLFERMPSKQAFIM